MIPPGTFPKKERQAVRRGHLFTRSTNFTHTPRAIPAFTLVELLVVIAVIALLISILLPTLGLARESASAAQCASAMRQWGLAAALYLADHRERLPRETGIQGVSAAIHNTTPGAWFNELPPYVDAPTYGQIYTGQSVGDLGGYSNEWIWYCPTRLRQTLSQKNSGTGRNSFHYAVNAVLNGSDGLTKIVNDPLHVPMDRIPQPSATLYLIEAIENSPARSWLKLDKARHYSSADVAKEDGKVNSLLLDGHVSLAGWNDLVPASSGEPYRTPDGLFWGPVR
jgi:type II secretory pathway pseudopilin PulG